MHLFAGLAAIFVAAALIVLAGAQALQAWQTTTVTSLPIVAPAAAESSYWYGRPQ
ncbi:hypothetical protein [Reyranella sp.]|uniref:hypothetical protein n=1 Tax=Reyranella sp. TaxID=1929291 RepID=UPI003BAA102B